MASSRDPPGRGGLATALVYFRTMATDDIVLEKFGIGQSARRIEDPRLIQGAGRYADDVTLPRQLHATIVRSPHAHAQVRSIDASRARNAAGVVAVLTGDDLAADKLGDLPTDRSRKR